MKRGHNPNMEIPVQLKRRRFYCKIYKITIKFNGELYNSNRIF